jgi:polyisoprenoid-binding protein YceI
MSFSSRALGFALAALAIARPAAAAELRAGTLELDRSQTLIEFRLPGRLHTTHGAFKIERGIIKADPGTGKAGGAIEVDAASGDSGLSARDNRMKNSILETQKYPEIVFTPQHVDGRMGPDGEFRATMRGAMVLHGSQHEMIIDAQGRLVGQELTATCHFSIPYVEWGMKDPSLPLLTVAKRVDIDVTTAGHVVWNAEGEGNLNQRVHHSIRKASALSDIPRSWPTRDTQ